jgi:hypothetical protein
MYAGQVARCEIEKKSAIKYPFSNHNSPPFDLSTESFSPISTVISTSSAKALPEPAIVDDAPKPEK